MIEQIVIESLTERVVNIKRQKYVDVSGTEYAVGEPHRCTYANSERDRVLIAAELPEPYLSAVMAVWGDAPTVFEQAD